ncbi:AraC family transcriptional regulator [Variovorax terrae]|uniref:AraC family transcriptional regulator n=1 Tax=Variovorax terrae TaxID=2923278 RepID=A0A9X1VSY7_9BURK|nr:AraC family transcriptional regulator [Variovorax terrae]MCJ0762375.1 AraC family transcriptional regulator [Variovorax terrae]
MAPISHLTRSASLTGYAALAQSAGLDPFAMMRKAGLPRRCLEDNEMLISLEAVCRLLDQCAEASRMEAFGLRLASRRHISELGAVSLVMKQEPSALRAVQTLLGYNRVLNDALLVRIEEEDDVVVIREHLMLGKVVPTRQAMELTVGVMFQVLRDLLGPGWQPRLVCFTHRQPRDARFHRSFLGTNLEFNSAFNGIVCAASDMARELTPEQGGLVSFARRFLDTELSQRKPARRETVRHLIAALLGNGRCTVERVAQHLGVSRQTLHRQLALEGEQFTSVLDSVRSEVALKLRNDSDHSLEDVASMLGFSSASAFAHWFRASFGMSFIRSRRDRQRATDKQFTATTEQ